MYMNFHGHYYFRVNLRKLEIEVDGSATNNEEAREVVAGAANRLSRAVNMVSNQFPPATRCAYQELPLIPIAEIGLQVRPTRASTGPRTMPRRAAIAPTAALSAD